MEKDNLEVFESFFTKMKCEFRHNQSITNESGKIDTRNKSDKKEFLNDEKVIIDAVVIFALKDPERDMFQRACSSSYTDDIKNGVAFRILEIKNESRNIRIAIATQREMGMISAAIL